MATNNNSGMQTGRVLAIILVLVMILGLAGIVAGAETGALSIIRLFATGSM